MATATHDKNIHSNNNKSSSHHNSNNNNNNKLTGPHTALCWPDPRLAFPMTRNTLDRPVCPTINIADDTITSNVILFSGPRRAVWSLAWRSRLVGERWGLTGAGSLSTSPCPSPWGHCLYPRTLLGGLAIGRQVGGWVGGRGGPIGEAVVWVGGRSGSAIAWSLSANWS